MANLQSLVILSMFCCGLAYKFPLHASCKVEWSLSAECAPVLNRIVSVINAWNGPENCKNGGEKCLYTLTSRSETEVKAKHKTPVKGYVDDLTFTFSSRSDSGCMIKGYSRSETWYALLDKGTNYCNLHNLIIGADLNRDPEYKEVTSNSVCTQYSSADCDKY